jgi:hypothetical protein
LLLVALALLVTLGSSCCRFCSALPFQLFHELERTVCSSGRAAGGAAAGPVLLCCLLVLWRPVWTNGNEARQPLLACCCCPRDEIPLKGPVRLRLQPLLVPLAQQGCCSKLVRSEVLLALLQLVAFELQQGLLHPAPVVLSL